MLLDVVGVLLPTAAGIALSPFPQGSADDGCSAPIQRELHTGAGSPSGVTTNQRPPFRLTLWQRTSFLPSFTYK